GRGSRAPTMEVGTCTEVRPEAGSAAISAAHEVSARPVGELAVKRPLRGTPRFAGSPPSRQRRVGDASLPEYGPTRARRLLRSPVRRVAPLIARPRAHPVPPLDQPRHRGGIQVGPCTRG